MILLCIPWKHYYCPLLYSELGAFQFLLWGTISVVLHISLLPFPIVFYFLKTKNCKFLLLVSSSEKVQRVDFSLQRYLMDLQRIGYLKILLSSEFFSSFIWYRKDDFSFLSGIIKTFKCTHLPKIYVRRIIRRFYRTFGHLHIRKSFNMILLNPLLLLKHMSGLLGYVSVLSLINILRESCEMQCFGHHFNSTEIWFHDKLNKKRVGSSPEADSPRSNDRHFEGNGLSQGPISKLHAMITSVKGSQEIKMRSCCTFWV